MFVNNWIFYCDKYSNLTNKNFGNVIGFPDYTRVLATITTKGASYTATENCWVVGTIEKTANEGSSIVYIDSIEVHAIYVQNVRANEIVFLPVKKGSIVTTRSESGTYNFKVYAMV